MVVNLKKIPFLFLSFILFAILLAACNSSEKSQTAQTNSGTTETNEESREDKNEVGEQATISLPNMMTWSVYDVGASGYSEMAAIANMLTEEYNMNVRMLPSASGVGRMIPLRDQTASIGKLGDEIQFAFEGVEEFGQPSWGPQDVTAIWAPVSVAGMAVRSDSDIQTLKDLKGKKIPWIVGNHSVNLKIEAPLALAGLTWDDVEVVELTSYSSQAEALIQGKIDVVGFVPTSAAMIEAESKVGIRWLDMDPNDTEGWKRVEKVAPWLFPTTTSKGAGIDGDINVHGFGYLIGGYANQDTEVIYQFVKAMVENFDKYGDATEAMDAYKLENVLTDPRGVPFHEGTVKYFKEVGLWDDEKQAKNDELVERAKKLKEAWDQVVDESVEQGISEADFPGYWLERKKELISD